MDHSTDNSRFGCEKFLNERGYLSRLHANERLVVISNFRERVVTRRKRLRHALRPLPAAAAAVGQAANGPEDDLPALELDDPPVAPVVHDAAPVVHHAASIVAATVDPVDDEDDEDSEDDLEGEVVSNMYYCFFM